MAKSTRTRRVGLGLFSTLCVIKNAVVQIKKPFLFLDVVAETEALQRILLAEGLCSAGKVTSEYSNY